MKKILFFSALAIITFFGLNKGGPELPRVINDLVQHFSGYLVLMILAILAYEKRQLAMFVSLFMYSILIEVIQYFLPYRTFSLADILANLCGLVSGAVLWLCFRYFSKKWKSHRQTPENP